MNAQVKITEEVTETDAATSENKKPAVSADDFKSEKSQVDILGEKIAFIVKAQGGNEKSEACSKAAKDHDPEEISYLLDQIGVKVEASKEETDKFLDLVDAAKTTAIGILTDKPKAKAKPKPKAKNSGAEKSKKSGEAKKKEPEITSTDPVKVAASVHEFPEKKKRAEKIPLPEFFYLETDQRVSGQAHQVDPSRRIGYTPVMPNVELFKTSQNPYEKSFDDYEEGVVQTSDKFKTFVAISHNTWSVFNKTPSEYFDPQNPETISEILSISGDPETTQTKLCIAETMRDCALYGLVHMFKKGRKRIFKVGD